MDIKTFEHLEKLSKLNYSEQEKQAAIAQMGDIIDLMDTIKEFDLSYDDTKDGNEVEYNSLRADMAKPSFETEKLLSNTQAQENCYVIPKMME